MKIYEKPKSILLIRIIVKNSETTGKITLCDTTFKECSDMVEKIISANEPDGTESEDKTVVTIREGQGSWNGKSVSFKTNMLRPEQIEEFIANEVLYNH